MELKNIRFTNCVNLLKVVLAHERRDEEFLRSRYLESGTHFDDTFLFLERLRMLRKTGDAISTADLTNGFFEEAHERKTFEQLCRKEVSKRLILVGDSASEVRHYLHHFAPRGGVLRYAPSTEQRIAEADLRNLLIELEVIVHDPAENDYVLKDQTIASHLLLSPSRHISKDAFRRMLNEREIIGDGAELAVLDYERNRLQGFPRLRDNIRHTAIDNVGAGYDISSFEGPSKGNPEDDRFIEVKAVSALAPSSFFWTINEIDAARTTREKYYLYLVPVKGKGDYSVDQMMVIRNPYFQVYANEEKWQRIPQSYRFQLQE